MKLILSRKGFDSQYGGYPSPILKDGRLVSLPIPSNDDECYSNLKLDDGMNYYSLMKGLNEKIRNKQKVDLTEETHCHRDPDIYRNIIQRPKDWRGNFGQSKAAQGHLTKKVVTKGDLFLYYGWFKKTIENHKKIQFDPQAPDLHVIFGYLQIAEISPLPCSTLHEWSKTNPHVQHQRAKNDTLYTAAENLSWNKKLPGSGVFKFDDSLVLTKKGHKKSQWDLPKIFENVRISYHEKSAWKDDYFQSASRGQAFVIDANKDVEEWAKNLINNNKQA